MPEQKNYRIIEFKAENVKRLKAVTIHPTGDIVQITGKNGEGKTSVLDAIELALSYAQGAKKNPEIVRKGQEKGSIRLDLGDFIVSRRFTAENSYLDVYTKEGAKYPSPQAVLDKMISTIAFDPLQFTNLEPKKQVDLLLEFSEISIDIPEQDRKIKQAEIERTDANRELKKVQAVFDSTPVPAKLELIEVESVSELMEQRKAIEKEKTVVETSLNTIIQTGAQLKKDIAAKQKLIKELELHLENAKKELAETEELLKTTTNSYKSTKASFDAGKYAERIGLLDDKIASGDKARSNNNAVNTYRTAEKNLKDAQSTAIEKETALSNLRSEREKAIQEAKFPIGGLGINEEGVTFGGIPFVQCSSAERLQVGIAMVIAQNPQIRVIRIQDGSLLDSDSMKVIKDMGEQYDIQFWIERVDETGTVGVVMEDGEAKIDNYNLSSVPEEKAEAPKPKRAKKEPK